MKLSDRILNPFYLRIRKVLDPFTSFYSLDFGILHEMLGKENKKL